MVFLLISQNLCNMCGRQGLLSIACCGCGVGGGLQNQIRAGITFQLNLLR